MAKAYVIGGANIDIQGASNHPLVLQDSNIGNVSYSFGGVARNIAENLALLKDEVVFVSAMGNDPFGKDMYQYCQSLGMDLTYCVQANQTSSMYLAIMDEKNDMALAINDMRILKHIDQSLLETVFSKIRPDDILIMDTNLDKEIITYLLDHCPCPIYLDPISTTKAKKICPYLDQIHMMKPNRMEAEIISGIYLDSKENYKKALQYFLDQGVEEIIISLGKDGVIAADRNQQFWMKHAFVPMKNATGAGDSFLAGYIHQTLKHANLEERVRFAIASAILTVSSEFTVSEYMSQDAVNQVLETIEMEKIELC
ncbi:MAG: carbohydrate kinase family protein [Erysipelotrichaceae bacterium]|nr:carbohydrate kinase family protein [Erysipelotrichaceae bacterium]